MYTEAFQTKLVLAGDSLFVVLREALPPTLPERSVLTVASKLPATCENRFVKKITGSREEKHALVEKEAEYFLPASASKYDVMLTIKKNWMFANAGIDESNANNQYVLWPEDPQQSAVDIWQWLRATYDLTEVGVILTDSRSMPLSWGVVGHAIGYAGIAPLYSYVDRPDLFGRPMRMEQINIIQALASVSSLVMGEGDECTPIGLLSDLPSQVSFSTLPPSQAELSSLAISLEEDIYAPLLTAANWQKGRGGK